jgi:hypothetical protein
LGNIYKIYNKGQKLNMNICKNCKNYNGEYFETKIPNWYKKLEPNVCSLRSGIHFCNKPIKYMDYITGIEKSISRLCNENNKDGNCPNFEEKTV